MAGKARHTLAKRVRYLRRRSGFTQQELAEKAGLDYKHLQTIEGKTPPNITLDSLERIAKALGVTLSDLFQA